MQGHDGRPVLIRGWTGSDLGLGANKSRLFQVIASRPEDDLSLCGRPEYTDQKNKGEKVFRIDFKK
jgi:hypothetical protein